MGTQYEAAKNKAAYQTGVGLATAGAGMTPQGIELSCTEADHWNRQVARDRGHGELSWPGGG